MIDFIFIFNIVNLPQIVTLLSVLLPLHINQLNHFKVAYIECYILFYLWMSLSCSTSWSLSCLAWSSLRWYSACCSERRPLRSSHSCCTNVSLWAADSSSHFILVLGKKICLNIYTKLGHNSCCGADVQNRVVLHV